MNIVMEFLQSDTAAALGWAFIHSFWQGLIVWLLVRVILRALPAVHARLRYAIACGGLLMLMISVIVTFLSLSGPGGAIDHRPPGHHAFFMTDDGPGQQVAVQPLFTSLRLAVETNMPWILLAWIAGVVFFLLRLTGGLFYAARIRSSAIPLENEWSSYLRRACHELGIHRLVSLAESALITAPVVIGYLKPVILTPVGMFAGLSSEQLQTIILHELAHVRRHDYLVNLVQSAVETLLFFNPFVWAISHLVRREREFCCDDLVIRHHGDSRAYAYALTLLAENKLSSHAVALSLAQGRNQLLHRIKRMMSMSTTNYSLKSRIILPLILLSAGLFSISWLGIQAPVQNRYPAHSNTEKDTIDRKKGKSAHYSRKSIITIDKDGQPHEEVIETFQGDEELRPLLKKIPSPPGLPLAPDFPPTINGLPVGPLDTIPPPPGRNSLEEWETFARAFEENFRKGFEELSESFVPHEEDSLFRKQFEQHFRAGDGDWRAPFHFSVPPDSFGHHWMRENDHALKALEEELKRLYEPGSGPFRKLMESLPERFHYDFNETSLVDQLRKDGYLSDGEALETLEWSENAFKVNGKEVSDANKEKYRRWFDGSSARERVE